MIISRTASSHYIPAGMFLLTENALGNPNLIQSSVPVDCQVTIVDADNVPLTELEEWPSFRLVSKDIQLTHGDGECFVYIAVPRTAIGNAEVVYPPVEIDRFGKRADGTQLGSTEYFYYKLGTVSAITEGERTVQVDLGMLPPVNNLPVGLSALEHMIEIEKGSPSDISQWVLSILSRTKLNKLEAERILFNANPNTYISQWIQTGSTDTPTDHAVFTSAYVKDNFLSRKSDDKAEGIITFKNGIKFGDLLLSLDGDNTLYLTNTKTGERANFAASGAIATKGIGKGTGGEGSASASALYQLLDVLKDATEDKVEGAVDGNILVYDGGKSKWLGKTADTISQSDETFLYEQSYPSNEWMIEHDLNKYPSVTVMDSAKSVVIGEVEYISTSKIILRFASEFSGTAVLN